MKKIILVFIIGILVVSSIGAAGIQTKQQADESYFTQFNTPLLQIQTATHDEYLSVELDQCSTYITTAGHPRLPTMVHVVELPFGVTDIDVSLNPGAVTTQQINGEIRPSLPLIPLVADYQQSRLATPQKDIQIYSMTTPYPTTWFTTSIGVGLNAENQRVTFVSIHYYPIRYTPATDTLHIANIADLSITYSEYEPSQFPLLSEYDLVIIAPSSFVQPLSRLVEHKESVGITTLLKTTEEIYDEYSGVDNPAQIKNFIKDAIETYDVTSVLLVGGLKNVILAKPRDDANQGSKSWYLPVRYTNLYDNPKFPLAAESTIFDPGTISDLYYADIYREGGAFSEWDVNGDGIFAAWGKPNVENDTGIDMFPDVAVGRLACRSKGEVRTVVNKIITYETTTYGQEWFKKMLVVSGDGFLDQEDLNFQWDTTGLPDGEYTIYAQSNNPTNDFGPIETINITIDKTSETVMTYNHDDHLRTSSYPGLPIAEITTVSEGDVLGNTDVTYVPGDGEAYCNQFYHWGNMSYIDEVLTIRGKSYDPQPYGNISSIHVWVEDSGEVTVFDDWRNDTIMYYEGEWTTGEKSLQGRGGALYYMPPEFDSDIIWTSNGRLTGQQDVIDGWSQGSGFMFFSGHGSPNVWADHYPGVPGNRAHGSVTGMQVTTLRPWSPFFTSPIFPMDSIKNNEKLPIAVIGGCHNSQFNVSMIYGVLDILHYYFPKLPQLYMWCHGVPVPETFSWRMVRNPRGGAIASIGNTGLGYGMPGVDLTTGGGDGWITIEFFRQYGEHGEDILGQTHSQSVTTYLNTFDMNDLESGHPKTVQQWVLLGDPTLQIGGYE